MSNKERAEEIGKIIANLATLWSQHQEQRLGQLLENYIFPKVQTRQGGITALTFFQEDTETLKKLQETNGNTNKNPNYKKTCPKCGQVGVSDGTFFCKCGYFEEE